ncbi:hypothetical protein PFISCL1PPCAC_11958, partial [Pristionchus fissidentatus]
LYEAEATNAEDMMLCQYTAAWSLVELYRSSRRRVWICGAKQRASMSLHILKTSQTIGGQNKKEAGVARLLAVIHGVQGERSEAEECLESAMALGEDKFELTKGKLDFEWSDKLVVANQLFLLAHDNRERLEASIAVAKAHFEQESIAEGIVVLHQLYPLVQQLKLQQLQQANTEEWERQAVFAFKAREASQRLLYSAMAGDRQQRFNCEDQLADVMASGKYHKTAMIHYEEALKFASTVSERISALTSLSVTASERCKYDAAVKYYCDLRQLEQKAGQSTTETEVELFKVRMTSGI